MKRDKTAEILKALNKFTEEQKTVREREGRVLLEKAKKEFEEIIIAQKRQFALQPHRIERNTWTSRKTYLVGRFANFRSWVRVVWLKISFLFNQIRYFLFNRFNRRH